MTNNVQTAHYSSPDASLALDIRYDHNTLWMSQAQMAQLFGKSVKTVNEHVKKEAENDISLFLLCTFR